MRSPGISTRAKPGAGGQHRRAIAGLCLPLAEPQRGEKDAATADWFPGRQVVATAPAICRCDGGALVPP